MPKTKALDERQILRLLGSGNYPAQVAKQLGVTRGAVHYWVKRLVTSGLLRLQQKGVMCYYALTEEGSRYLTGSEERPRMTVVSEDYAIKYPILREPQRAVDWVKLGKPRNWVKLGFTVGGIQVVKTTKHIIVHPGQVKGYDPYELLYLQGEMCGRVVRWLEDHLGMRVGRGEPIRKPGIQIYDPVAKLLNRYYTLKDDVGAVDASPPSKEAHLEYWDPRWAKSALLAPMHLEAILSQLNVLAQGQVTTSQQMKTLIDASILTTTALRELTESLSPKKERPLDEREDYVV